MLPEHRMLPQAGAVYRRGRALPRPQLHILRRPERGERGGGGGATALGQREGVPAGEGVRG